MVGIISHPPRNDGYDDEPTENELVFIPDASDCTFRVVGQSV